MQGKQLKKAALVSKIKGPVEIKGRLPVRLSKRGLLLKDDPEESTEDLNDADSSRCGSRDRCDNGTG